MHSSKKRRRGRTGVGTFGERSPYRGPQAGFAGELVAVTTPSLTATPQYSTSLNLKDPFGLSFSTPRMKSDGKPAKSAKYGDTSRWRSSSGMGISPSRSVPVQTDHGVQAVVVKEARALVSVPSTPGERSPPGTVWVLLTECLLSGGSAGGATPARKHPGR